MGEPMPSPDRMRPDTTLPELADRAVPHDLALIELPRVRLVHGLITCPRCDKKHYHLRVRTGEAWLPCNHERLERRGACRARWLNLTLPGGSLGRDLLAMVGEAAGLTLMRHCFPQLADATPAQIALVALGAGTPEDRDAPSHVQITVRGRDEHHYRWSPVAAILDALGVR